MAASGIDTLEFIDDFTADRINQSGSMQRSTGEYSEVTIQPFINIYRTLVRRLKLIPNKYKEIVIKSQNEYAKEKKMCHCLDTGLQVLALVHTFTHTQWRQHNTCLGSMNHT